MLVFENNIRENRAEFAAKVRQIAKALRIDPNWLMIVMMSESGLNHRIINSIGCVGLIQFCPSGGLTRTGLSAQALASMSNVQQLDYVYQYYAPMAGRFRDVYDLYLYTFYPAAVGQPDNYVIGSRYGNQWQQQVYWQNKGFDVNGNGVITNADFKNFVYKKYGQYIGKAPSANNWLWYAVGAYAAYLWWNDELDFDAINGFSVNLNLNV